MSRILQLDQMADAPGDAEIVALKISIPPPPYVEASSDVAGDRRFLGDDQSHASSDNRSPVQRLACFGQNLTVSTFRFMRHTEQRMEAKNLQHLRELLLHTDDTVRTQGFELLRTIDPERTLPIQLRGARFSHAYIAQQDLRRFDLTRVDLSSARLEHIDLRGAILNHARLWFAHLHGCDLCDARMIGCQGLGTQLIDCVLNRADMQRSGLSGWIVERSLLSGVKLSNACIQRCVFHAVHLDGASLRESHIDSSDLSDVDLRGADLRGATFRLVRLCGADLSGACLDNASFTLVNYDERTRWPARRPRQGSLWLAPGLNLRHIRLERQQLPGFHLRGADLFGAMLRNADLRDADLRDVNLRRANLSGCDLRYADLSGANLTGADLRGAKLTGAYLDGACLRDVQREPTDPSLPPAFN